MVVKLDLRSAKQELHTEEDKSPRHYILFSLAALFVLAALALFALGSYRFYSLGRMADNVAAERHADDEQLERANAELDRLTNENSALEARLDFVLGDIPSVEFLYELNERLIDGIVVESLTMTQTTASLKGVAFADEEVLEFGEELLKASSVRSVSLPVISAAKRNGANLRAFSIELALNPLRDIALSASSGSSSASERDDPAPANDSGGEKKGALQKVLGGSDALRILESEGKGGGAQ